MTIANIVATLAAVLIVSAPSENPSWWKENTQEDMELLALHLQKANEITVKDSHTVTRLYFDSQVLEAFENVNRELVRQGSNLRASPQDVLDAIEKTKNTIKALIVEQEKEQAKKRREEQQGTWRTYEGKNA
jgi:TRAP-type mannitol/chloroaromatic compound transport system substrate-binding protein